LCDDSLSAGLAAAIYREKTCPWRKKPDWPPGLSGHFTAT
jgi:hypothetical protein